MDESFDLGTAACMGVITSEMGYCDVIWAHFTSRPDLHPNTDLTKELSCGDGTIPSLPPRWATESQAAISQPASGDEAATVAAAAAPPDAQPSAEAQQAAASAAPPSANAQHVVELEVDECGKSDGDYMNEFLDDLVELVKDRDTDLGTQAVWEKFPDKARQRMLVHEGPGE